MADWAVAFACIMAIDDAMLLISCNDSVKMSGTVLFDGCCQNLGRSGWYIDGWQFQPQAGRSATPWIALVPGVAFMVRCAYYMFRYEVAQGTRKLYLAVARNRFQARAGFLVGWFPCIQAKAEVDTKTGTQPGSKALIGIVPVNRLRASWLESKNLARHSPSTSGCSVHVRSFFYDTSRHLHP
jgi:hypothetical protein